MTSKSGTRLVSGSYCDLIKSKQSKSEGKKKVKEGYHIFLIVGIKCYVLNFHFLISTDSWTDMIYFFWAWTKMAKFCSFLCLSPTLFFFSLEHGYINQIVTTAWHVLLLSVCRLSLSHTRSQLAVFWCSRNEPGFFHLNSFTLMGQNGLTWFHKGGLIQTLV